MKRILLFFMTLAVVAVVLAPPAMAEIVVNAQPVVAPEMEIAMAADTSPPVALVNGSANYAAIIYGVTATTPTLYNARTTNHIVAASGNKEATLLWCNARRSNLAATIAAGAKRAVSVEV